ncbi:hypothetical protein GCM10009801_44070 [Streptomyces albiaxialis]|uniref:DUF1449 family protein n=1 Tax=Streptomyces albiaxialis TaxID=329523 RepID=A0ABN2W4Z3_9ACTN
MRTFAEAALAFPTVCFSAALAVVVVFWLLVAVGAAEGEGPGGWVWGGVPLTVGFSFLAAFAWFLSLAAMALLAPLGLSGTPGRLAGSAVLVTAPLLGWRAARALLRPLAALFPDEPPPSRADFVGLTCVIRTGRVDAGFGQAEVRSRDGSTALVQVRQYGDEALALGDTGLLYAYEADGEFFWVARFDDALPGA